MKIAHIITRLIVGGAQENTLFNCIDLMDSYGDDVFLLTGPTAGPEGSLMPWASAKIPTKIIPNLIRRISPVHDVKAYRELRQSLDEYKPDVVHTHSAKAGILGRAAAWSLNPRPVVIHSVHGAPFYPYQNVLIREFYKSCERWAAKRCDAIICVADAMTELMVNANIAPREKFTTIYSGMDTEPFLKSKSQRDITRMKLGLTDEHIVVGKIARLFRLKGHEFVIEAASSIVQRIPNVRFLFVGDGILTAKCRSQIARLGLEKHFLFTGLVKPEEIPALISAMDIIVHTSLREGLARVLPQALLSGKPVISYDVDGAKEVVLDGKTGILLPPKSVKELADAVVRLAENPVLCTQMGQTGQQKFAKQFDHCFMTEQIRSMYQQFRSI